MSSWINQLLTVFHKEIKVEAFAFSGNRNMPNPAGSVTFLRCWNAFFGSQWNVWESCNQFENMSQTHAGPCINGGECFAPHLGRFCLDRVLQVTSTPHYTTETSKTQLKHGISVSIFFIFLWFSKKLWSDESVFTTYNVIDRPSSSLHFLVIHYNHHILMPPLHVAVFSSIFALPRFSLFPSPSRVSSQIETPWCESPDWGHLNHAAQGPASKCGQEPPVASATDSRDSRDQGQSWACATIRHVGHGQSWTCAIGQEPHWASVNWI